MESIIPPHKVRKTKHLHLEVTPDIHARIWNALKKEGIVKGLSKPEIADQIVLPWLEKKETKMIKQAEKRLAS